MEKLLIGLFVISGGLIGWRMVAEADTTMSSTATITFLPNPDVVNNIRLTEKENGLSIDMPIINEGLTIQTRLLEQSKEANLSIHYLSPTMEPLSQSLSEDSVALLDSQYQGEVGLAYSGSMKEGTPVIVEYAVVVAP